MTTNILVIGAGGREHAICWALHQAPSVASVSVAPGNPGMADVATCISLDITNHAEVIAWCQANSIDLVVIGPEVPLIAGLADDLRAQTIPVYGPSAQAAQLEGSKAFAKAVMGEAGVDTAHYWAGSDVTEAKAAAERFGPEVVVKADGLAAGKGVVMCSSVAEAHEAIDAIMVDKTFGKAGDHIVIEEMMTGPECSLFGICDGTTVRVMQSAQDFKRIGEGDIGLNTGGMGAYSPVPAVPPAMADELVRTVMQPVLDVMAKRGTPFIGTLYAGLMLTPTGPRVLEFNARFGDPETQIVLPRLQSDLGEVLYAAATGTLASQPPLVFTDQPGVTVVVASGGYPGDYPTGLPMSGLDSTGSDTVVFHAGTKRAEDGTWLTAGGRVLSVSALGSTLEEARAKAYATVDAITFEGAYHRRDIAEHPTLAL